MSESKIVAISTFLDSIESEALEQSIRKAISLNAFLSIISSFEAQKSSELTQKKGIFYTPQAVVQKMVSDCSQNLLCKFKDLPQELHILDQACGAGLFLLECLDLLIADLKKRKCDSLERRIKILENNIFGIDIDSSSVKLCKVLLAARIFIGFEQHLQSVEVEAIRFRIYHANGLLEKDDAPGNSEVDFGPLLNWRSEFKEVFSKANPGFDLIIGNPPYGLSRNEKLSPRENDLLRRKFKHFKFGKINKYMAFMAAGYEMLACGGALSLIVPNAWLGIKSGSELRKIFLNDGSLEAIDIFEKKVFTKLGVETFIFRCRKNENIKLISINRIKDLKCPLKSTTSHIATEFCLRSPDHLIPTEWSEQLETLQAFIDKNCFLLGDSASLFKPLIAIQAYAVGKGLPPQTEEQVKFHAFHYDRMLPNCQPYLEGRDIQRYKLNWSGKFLAYGPWLAEHQPIERFCGPRIVMREILNPYPYKISAAFVKEPYIYNKSVLHILPKSNTSEQHLMALLGILNSAFAGYYIRFFGRKSQRNLFPKLVNSDLKSFPLPLDFTDTYMKIADRVRSLCNLNLDSCKQNELQKSLDMEVLEAYKLNPALLSETTQCDLSY